VNPACSPASTNFAIAVIKLVCSTAHPARTTGQRAEARIRNGTAAHRAVTLALGYENWT
jgi:hypothetical protein